MKKLFIYILLLLALLSACSRETRGLQDGSNPGADASLEETIDLNSLIAKLQTQGYTVQDSGDLDQPFFSVHGTVLTLKQDDLQIFEYAFSAAMQSEAQLVDPGGSSIGTTMVTWIETPHFFKGGRIIVIYLGDDDAILGDLQNIFGAQFAGR